jgi:S-adenosylmethionine-dependent methyltransferase
MRTTANVFDTNIAQWTHEQGLPWQKLKYKLAQANLAKHLGPGPLHVLDAGGGNGFDSIPLAQQGHRVEIVDYSREMLAEARRTAALAQTQEKVTVHQADLRDVRQLFPGVQFDLVLCHNVLQYLEDAHALFKDLVASLKTGGVISVVSINRYSIAYRTAFPRGDLAQALNEIDAHSMQGKVFNTTLSAYSAVEIEEILKGEGCEIEQDYGIRCICDYWGDNELKSNPAVFQQLERLEFALTERHPYKLLARYYQVVAHKI